MLYLHQSIQSSSSSLVGDENRLRLERIGPQRVLAGVLSRLNELTTAASSRYGASGSIQLDQCEISLGDGYAALSYENKLFIVPILPNSTASSSSSTETATRKRTSQQSSSAASALSSKKLDEFGMVQLPIRLSNDDDEETISPSSRNSLSPFDRITSLQWVMLNLTDTPSSQPSPFLIVGFSNGCVRIFRPNGVCLFTQRVHKASVRRLRVHLSANARKNFRQKLSSAGSNTASATPAGAIKPSPSASASSSSASLGAAACPDLYILHANGVVGYIDSRSLFLSIRDAVLAIKSSEEGGPRPPDGFDLPNSSMEYPWNYRVWTVEGAQAKVEDLLPADANMGEADLFALPLAHANSSAAMALSVQSQPKFLAVGSEPALAFFSPSNEEDDAGSSPSGPRGTHSTRGAIKLAASKLTSAVFSMAKTWWNSDTPQIAGGDGSNGDESPSLAEPNEIGFERCIRDGTRQILSVIVDPLNSVTSATSFSSASASSELVDGAYSPASYGVLSDNFGRVMLLEMQQFVLVRMWKGYRDAQCSLVRQQILTGTASEIAKASTTTTSSPAKPSPSASISSAAGTSSQGTKKAKNKLSIVKQVVSDEEEDPLKDFDSAAPATKSNAPVPSPSTTTASSKLSSNPASLSTHVPSSTRTSTPPLFLVLYAPRRGQVELWSLPYGSRIGARVVGVGCRLLSSSSATLNASTGQWEVTAYMLKPDGDMQSITITAEPPRALEPPPPPTAEELAEAAANAADAESASLEISLMDTAQRKISEWARRHQCSGFNCSTSRDELAPLVHPMLQLKSELTQYVEASTSLLPDRHLLRVANLIQQRAELMWRSLIGDASPDGSGMALCPRLSESLLQATLEVLTSGLNLATPPSIVSSITQMKIEDAKSESETTITITREIDEGMLSLSGLSDRELLREIRLEGGKLLQTSSANLLKVEQMKESVQGWLQMLAVYHTACAPAGRSIPVTSFASLPGKKSTSFSLMPLTTFLSCFSTRFTANPQEGKKSVASSSSPPIEASSTDKSESASSSASIYRSVFRFGLNDAFTTLLTHAIASSSSIAPNSPLVTFAQLLFGPTASSGSGATGFSLKESDYIASKSLDMLLHLDLSFFSRRQLTQLFIHGWWNQLSQKLLDDELMDESKKDWKGFREQLQLLLIAFAQRSPDQCIIPDTDANLVNIRIMTKDPLLPLSGVSSFLSTLLSVIYNSPLLTHAGALLRLIRTWLLLPQLDSLNAGRESHLARTKDHDIDNAEQHAQIGRAIQRTNRFYSIVDLSVRIHFRHLCQLQFLRGQFPLSSVKDEGVITLRLFTHAFPLARMVALHLIQQQIRNAAAVFKSGSEDGMLLSEANSGANQEDILSKEDIQSKLANFESVLSSVDLSSSGDSSLSDSSNSTAQVSAVTAHQQSLLPQTETSTDESDLTVTVPISEWDWVFTSDDGSCYMYASLQSIQRFFDSAITAASLVASSGHSIPPSFSLSHPRSLVAAVKYLEYCPVSAVSGGLAVFMWNQIFAPHLRALVHAAYPDFNEVSKPSPAGTSTEKKPTAAVSTVAPLSFLKSLKQLYSTPSASHTSRFGAASSFPLLNFSDLETLRAILSLSHRVLLYLSACYAAETKMESWEGVNYFCPAIAQTIDPNHSAQIPIRQADQLRKTAVITAAGSNKNSTNVIKDAGSAASGNNSSVASFALEDHFLASMTNPAWGPPASSETPSVCTSLFHTHVRFVHPENKSASYANVPSPLYAQLLALYEQFDLDQVIAENIGIVELLSSHVELDVVVPSLESLQSTIAHMYPTHPFVVAARTLKASAKAAAVAAMKISSKGPVIVPPSHIFPQLNPALVSTYLKQEKKTTSSSTVIDVVNWIGEDFKSKYLDWPEAEVTAIFTSSSSSAPTPSVIPIISTAPEQILAARLQFLMSLLKDRPSLTTAPVVYSLGSIFQFPSYASESLQREHVLLLFERGEDSRAWELLPRLEDVLEIATILISVGRNRLGLFLHAMEKRHAAKYAQMVSGVPAASWQWLAKAQPPHVMAKRKLLQLNPAATSATAPKPAAASSSSTKPTTPTPVPPVKPSAYSHPVYFLSGVDASNVPASPPVTSPTFSIFYHLQRAISIQQKASDIDIHATLLLLKRVRDIIQKEELREKQQMNPAEQVKHAEAVERAEKSAMAASVPPAAKVPTGSAASAKAIPPRTETPLTYARAYASELANIATTLIQGINAHQ